MHKVYSSASDNSEIVDSINPDTGELTELYYNLGGKKVTRHVIDTETHLELMLLCSLDIVRAATTFRQAHNMPPMQRDPRFDKAIKALKTVLD